MRLELTASHGPSCTCPAPPFAGMVYLAEIGDPSAFVPVTVTWKFSPCSSITSVISFGGWPAVYFDFAVSSFHVPTNGLCANNAPANANSATVEINLCIGLLSPARIIYQIRRLCRQVLSTVCSAQR